MKDQSHFSIYAGAYFRGALYCFIILLSGFDNGFKGLSHEQVASMSHLDWVVKVAEVFLGALITIRAFLDGSVERSKNGTDAAEANTPPQITIVQPSSSIPPAK